MKIIDLLNKIVNGEEVPIFAYEGCRYKYDEELHMFIDLDNEGRCKNTIYFCELNDEVYIIEEDKKIEKLSILTFSDLIDMPKEELVDIIKEQRFKINEIINVINKGDK